MRSGAILELDHVSLSYGETVVRDVSLTVEQGEILALAGESGSGKTTLLRGILGLPGTGIRLSGGGMYYDGMDLERMGRKERSRLWGREITMIFQDPGAAFNPIRSYRKQFAELLKSHGRFYGRESFDEVRECLESLGLSDGERILASCPYELSGGMNQRIAIAAAMLLKPRLLLADEPTSALDVLTRKGVLDALLRMQKRTGTAMLFVTHDLGAAARVAGRIGIMCRGRLVECGETGRVLSQPEHPCTRSLLAAVPSPGQRMQVPPRDGQGPETVRQERGKADGRDSESGKNL